jgi:hypothetical protein
MSIIYLSMCLCVRVCGRARANRARESVHMRALM